MPQLRNSRGQLAHAWLSSGLKRLPHKGHWTCCIVPAAASVCIAFFPHMSLSYPTPRACMTHLAPPPTVRARAMVKAMIAAARLQPSSLPRTATVATQGM